MKAISHADVVEALIAQDPDRPASSKKSLKSCCKRWCLTIGVGLDDPAESTLGSSFEERLHCYQEQLQRTSCNQRAAKNVRSAAKRMRETYVALLASQDLPADFNAALRMAMDAKQYKPADLNRILIQRYYSKEQPGWYGAQLWSFYAGTARPGRSWYGDSRHFLTRCEEVLELSPGTLVTRAYPPPNPILLGPRVDIPFRRARSEQAHATYGLRKLPARVQRIWSQYVGWRVERDHCINGKVHVSEPLSVWTSPSSVSKHQRAVLRFYGWLCLPAATTPLTELPDGERWTIGKGMDTRDLKIAHLLDSQLIWEFITFQKFRQHNRELTKSHLDFLMLANSFVSKPYSFLVAHPDLAEEFGFAPPASEDAWRTQMEEVHQRFLAILRPLKRAVRDADRQRSPDEPLRHVMDHESPYTLFLEMLSRMEKSEPLRNMEYTWSMWARDVAIHSMLLEIPLRSKNVRDLRVGTHLNRDAATGLWRLFIPKKELKNHYSRSAQDISRTYSAKASRAMDRYYDEARPNLVGAGMTDVFLLGPSAGRRGANSESVVKGAYKLSTATVYRVVAKQLERYFGQTQGTNVFRHLIATSILKDDPTQVEVAAAVLNNSPSSVRTNYKHLTQADGLRLSQRWFDRQRKQDPQKKKGNP